jgi:predicted DNA-binding protein
MGAKQLATKIDEDIKNILDKVCESRGIKINRFIEEAILDKLEELEDIEDLKKLRAEKFTDFKDVIKELKDLGKL